MVVYEPTGQEDVDGAKQAQAYANWVWRKNHGFMVFYTWFKDALLQKNGAVKVWSIEMPAQTAAQPRSGVAVDDRVRAVSSP